MTQRNPLYLGANNVPTAMNTSSDTVASELWSPMTAANDLIVGGTSGAPTRKAVGMVGQPFGVDSSGNANYLSPNMFPSFYANPLRAIHMCQANGASDSGIQSQGINGAQMSASGSASTSYDSDGSWNNYRSASSSGVQAGWQSGGAWAQFQCYPAFLVAVKLVDLSAARLWFGFSSGGALFSSDDPSSSHMCAFRLSSTAGDTNFKCYTSDGSASNIQDSGVAGVSTDPYVLALYRDPANGNAVFVINGSIVATSSAHLPGASSNLYSIYGLTTTTGTAKNIKLKCDYASQR